MPRNTADRLSEAPLMAQKLLKQTQTIEDVLKTDRFDIQDKSVCLKSGQNRMKTQSLAHETNEKKRKITLNFVLFFVNLVYARGQKNSFQTASEKLNDEYARNG